MSDQSHNARFSLDVPRVPFPWPVMWGSVVRFRVEDVVIGGPTCFSVVFCAEWLTYTSFFFYFPLPPSPSSIESLAILLVSATPTLSGLMLQHASLLLFFLILYNW